MGNVDCRNFLSKNKKGNEIKYTFSVDTHHNLNININNITNSSENIKMINSQSPIILNNSLNINNNSGSFHEMVFSSKEINSISTPSSESEETKKIIEDNGNHVKFSNFCKNLSKIENIKEKSDESITESENNSESEKENQKESQDNNNINHGIKRKSIIMNFEHRRMPIEIIEEKFKEKDQKEQSNLNASINKQNNSNQQIINNANELNNYKSQVDNNNNLGNFYFNFNQQINNNDIPNNNNLINRFQNNNNQMNIFQDKNNPINNFQNNNNPINNYQNNNNLINNFQNNHNAINDNFQNPLYNFQGIIYTKNNNLKNNNPKNNIQNYNYYIQNNNPKVNLPQNLINNQKMNSNKELKYNKKKTNENNIQNLIHKKKTNEELYWKNLNIKNIIPLEKRSKVYDNTILLNGYFNVFSRKTLPNCKLETTSRFIILTRSELKIYRSLESKLFQKNPLRRISLFNISKCDLFNNDNSRIVHKNLELNFNFFIEFITINKMVNNDETLIIHHETNYKHNFNYKLINKNYNPQRRKKKISFLSGSTLDNGLCKSKNNQINNFDNNSEILVLSSNDEKLINQWVTVINYFIN